MLQELPSLDVTERGEAGFGSTGTNWPTNLGIAFTMRFEDNLIILISSNNALL